ncbi:Tetratricopeptide TPR_2 [Shewanella denitrificans OS217]|uniref:Tetratricopeptide TPR_2 n=1 Tax=Shewanella denitrificans (strain OS217 / ATCC BAA-1090 / DSM 15013) TaxID=318161 RepID=Q12IV5_SHEDO|nr:tetratricopeptide repeat protein [Shewanella denitrificans]ABE56621.1 Tetratricopeptide TPR_2 [Shewanella denitrificans OS217]
MSLINQVLQDLDKRQPASIAIDKPEGADFVRPELQFKSQQSFKNKPSKVALTLVSLVVSLAMVAGVWQLYQNQGFQDQGTQGQDPQQLSQPVISAANMVVAEPAKDVVNQEVAVAMIAAEGSVEQQIDMRTDSKPALAKIVLKQSQTITPEPITPEPIASVSKASKPITPEPIAVEPMTHKLIPQQSASLAVAGDSAAVPVVSDADAELDAVPPAQGNMAVTEVVLTLQQRANKLMIKAETAENKGRFAEAKRDYLQVLALVPEQTEARKKLLGLYYAQGELSQAMALVEQAISSNPEPWQWLLLKAKLQQGGGALSMALATLDTIPDQGIWAKDKWAAQGDIAQKLGEFAIAAKAFTALTLVDADKGLWWMGLAYAQDSQQQYSLARQSYLTAMQRAGLSSSARTFIENRLKELGERR